MTIRETYVRLQHFKREDVNGRMMYPRGQNIGKRKKNQSEDAHRKENWIQKVMVQWD